MPAYNTVASRGVDASRASLSSDSRVVRLRELSCRIRVSRGNCDDKEGGRRAGQGMG